MVLGHALAPLLTVIDFSYCVAILSFSPPAGSNTQKGMATMEMKRSQTERNLVTAFVGESVARNRYTFFASQARNDGYIQIAQIFEETANQEKEHAKRFFKSLQGGDVKIESAFPAGIVGTTLEKAESILQQHRIEKLPIVDKRGKLRGTAARYLVNNRHPVAADTRSCEIT